MLLLTCINMSRPSSPTGLSSAWPSCNLPWCHPKRILLGFLSLLFLITGLIKDIIKRYNSEKALAKCTTLIPREQIFVALPILVSWALGKKPCFFFMEFRAYTAPFPNHQVLIASPWNPTQFFLVTQDHKCPLRNLSGGGVGRGRVWTKRKRQRPFHLPSFSPPHLTRSSLESHS